MNGRNSSSKETINGDPMIVSPEAITRPLIQYDRAISTPSHGQIYPLYHHHLLCRVRVLQGSMSFRLCEVLN
jgi:hypothetical protein